MAHITRNLEKTIEIVGSSIVFHQIAFERNKIYDSKQSKFWANVYYHLCLANNVCLRRL